eukprot:TRINITY_DN59982_c0_g1_i1.p1 TRINITY_DN59982_c0_g1~~TRINITY_DN59982_c0_g1_i1.p1  ORF type:complete len:623 (+),score=216.84 TRINITY_DN59982_c0_g1_i1:78-1871(+)
MPWANARLDQCTVNFPSEWKCERKPTEGEQWATQTEEQQFGEVEQQTVLSLFQTLETAEADVQTLERPECVPEPVPDEFMDGWWTYPGAVDADHEKGKDKLGFFLDSVAKEVEEMLNGNVQSFAFDGYGVVWDEEKSNFALLHTLIPPIDSSNEEDLQVVDLSWNCNGVTIAAAFGRIDEVAWCKGSGRVCCWNTARKELGKPDTVIYTASYVTSIAFHPTQPSLLLGGSYTGEVYLWDTSASASSDQQRTPVVCHTDLSATSAKNHHREPITKVQWLADRSVPASHKNHFLMCTAAGDGRLLFWARPEHEPGTLEGPVQGYVLRRANTLAAAARRRLVDSDSDDERVPQAPLAADPHRDALLSHVGIQSICVLQPVKTSSGRTQVPFADNPLIIGSEMGQVYKTKVDIPRVKKPMVGDDQELRPLQIGSDALGLEQHFGPVQACCASPFDRNLFMTVSSDGTAKLRSGLEKASLLTLEPGGGSDHFVYCADWSPMRPCVLALGTRNSQVHVYDLEQTSQRAVSLDAGEEHPVLSVRFNPVESGILATGDGRGCVKLWQLASQFSQLTQKEQQLTTLAAKDDDRRRRIWSGLIGISI